MWEFLGGPRRWFPEQNWLNCLMGDFQAFGGTDEPVDVDEKKSEVRVATRTLTGEVARGSTFAHGRLTQKEEEKAHRLQAGKRGQRDRDDNRVAAGRGKEV